MAEESKFNPGKLESDALSIAEIISAVDTDLRGNLLMLVGENLKSANQGFTGHLIMSLALEYGINPNAPRYPNHKSEVAE